MIICTNICTAYETTNIKPNEEHLNGMIEISIIPPDNLEDPKFWNNEFYDLDLVLINSDKPTKLLNKEMQWDNALWKITAVRLVSKTIRQLFISRINDL